ncbi:MAG: hypothetical protein HY811_04275 [Planctomycetes bacterium]|nr:hypothetical protein [Planctomycetota bacterium]
MGKDKKVTLKDAIILGLLIDLFLLFCSSLILDGRVILFFSIITVAFHLSISVFIIIRKRGLIKPSDIDFILFGGLMFLPAFILFYFIAILLYK